jgi:uridylate kinase
MVFKLLFPSDPAKNPLAKKYARLSYRQCTDDSLRVMDGESPSASSLTLFQASAHAVFVLSLHYAETAITLCKENNIPVLVLNMLERGTIMRAVLGEPVGTVVCEGCDEDEAVLLA